MDKTGTETDYGFREVFEIYLIGAVILFTLSVGGTFLISLFKSSVDLLAPLKALTLYAVFAFLLLDYLIYRFFDGLKQLLSIGTAVAFQMSLMTAFISHIGRFFGETQYYSLGNYPLMFKILPAVSLLFAIAGVFVVVYYSVDIKT